MLWKYCLPIIYSSIHSVCVCVCVGGVCVCVCVWLVGGCVWGGVGMGGCHSLSWSSPASPARQGGSLLAVCVVLVCGGGYKCVCVCVCVCEHIIYIIICIYIYIYIYISSLIYV